MILLPPLLVLTDRRGCERRGRTLPATVAAAVGAGARAVVLREKDLSRPERERLGAALLALLRPVAGTLVVASDVRLAAELGAGWAHLAETDPWPPGRARIGLGRSCHDGASLALARERGAAYATLSPVFTTASKPGYGPALGLSRLSALARETSDLPVYALGGVDATNAGACLQTGARGVAVMGAVMNAEDPGAAVRELLAALAARARRPGESSAQAVQIKEASSEGRQRTEVRDRRRPHRPASSPHGADAELDGNQRG